MKNITNIASIIIKSFTFDAKVEVSLDGDLIIIKKDNYINRLPSKLQLKFLRGYIDNSLLHILYSNPNIYNQYLPATVKHQEIYSKCEEARYEAIGALAYKGISVNLQNKWKYYCLINGYNLFDSVEFIKTEDIISFIIRNYITNHPYPFDLSRLFNNLCLEKLNLYLPSLKENLYNQEKYAQIICNIAKDFENIFDPSKEDFLLINSHNLNSEILPNTNSPPQIQDNINYEGEESENTLPTSDKNIDIVNESVSPQSHYSNIHLTSQYKIYNSSYDEIILANKLVSPDEANKLRQKLDNKILELSRSLTKSVNNFKRKLQSKKYKYFQTNLEAGTLDNSKFPMLIADHNYSNLYKAYRENIDFNTVVTLLIDSSGSMRGKPINIAAICADMLSKILEECSIKIEILGFTTKDWQGGEVKKQWIKNNQPPLPGRLNAIRHIIYKDSNKTYKSAKKNISIMLKDGLLKENIDGEALIWAYKRILKKPQKRKILIVISDGAPIDEATLSNNQNNYLDIHLREVIKSIEHSHIELIAIGIGHDVTNYYRNSITIKSPEELTDTIFNKLSNIL